MAEAVVSIALLDVLPGKEEELLVVLRQFYAMMRAKGYSSDWLYRDTDRPHRLIHMRRWNSRHARVEAQADPDVHRYWQQLPDLCTIPTVYEDLETLITS